MPPACRPPCEAKVRHLGQQLWLFANGRWAEPLLLEVKDRTTISSNTTLPYNEPDYEAALTFALSEATRLTGQLRREQLQARELSLSIRFDDFSETGALIASASRNFGIRYQHRHRGNLPRHHGQSARPVRQIRSASGISPPRYPAHPVGQDRCRTLGALDEAAHKLNGSSGKSPS